MRIRSAVALVALVGGGAVTATAPPARHRQIELIGDSYTAGYGDMSATRTCTVDEIHRTTNAARAFGALTARRFGADYRVNAFSGRGMVRTYNGSDPGTDYRTYYGRALLAVPGDVWPTRGWRPQLVVVGLGSNDFSTPVNPGEPWTAETPAAAYRDAYQGFLDTLRAVTGIRPAPTTRSSRTGWPGSPAPCRWAGDIDVTRWRSSGRRVAPGQRVGR